LSREPFRTNVIVGRELGHKSGLNQLTGAGRRYFSRPADDHAECVSGFEHA